MKAKTIAICNQKGGVGKTTTAIGMGAALSLNGYKVLLIDGDDSNPTLTKVLVNSDPDNIKSTLVDLMLFRLLGRDVSDELTSAIYKHEEGYDIIPATSKLAGITNNLNVQQDNDIKTLSLKHIITKLQNDYDYIIIDAAPALNTFSVNILGAADELIIATQAQDAAEAGIGELIQTVSNVKKNINPALVVKGLLITMEDNRTNYSKQTAQRITDNYSDLGMRVFNTHIPRAVKAEEYVNSGKSVIAYDQKGKVSQAYISFTAEYLESEE